MNIAHASPGARLTHRDRAASGLLRLVTLAAVLSAPRASRATTAQEVLDAWAQALGGRPKLQTIESMHRVSQIEASGLQGRLDEWVTARGQYRQDIVLGDGVYKELQVFDGKSGWTRDQNSKVQPMAGNDLQDAMNVAYLGSWSHLLPGRRPGQVEYLGQDEAKQLDKLRITPDGGRAVVYFLDRKTHLPTREETTQGDQHRTSTFSDWRAVDGVQMSFTITSGSGETRYDVRATVQELKWNTAPSPDTFAQPAEAAPDFHFTSGQSATGIPFELQTTNHIFVQVRVNGGEPSWFILDTGAEATVLDVDRAQALKLPLEGHIEGRGAGEGSVDVSLVKGVTIGLPGVEVANQSIVAVQLGALEPLFGRRIDGVLGYDFISRFVLQIDYAGGKLSLYDPRDYKYVGQGEVIPISVEGRLPHISARVVLPDKTALEGKFVVDCGAGSLVDLNSPFVEAHKIRNLVASHSTAGGGIGGTTKMAIARLAAVQVGKYEIADPVVGLSEDTGGALSRSDLDGIIGGELLRRFTVVFDYPHERLILDPNSHFKDSSDRGRTGIRLIADGPDLHMFKVFAVTEGSPAANAGVKPGDFVTTIDGRPLGDASLDDVRHLLDQPDHAAYTLGLRREGSVLSLTVTAKSWL
jgi:hypothetical protein